MIINEVKKGHISLYFNKSLFDEQVLNQEETPLLYSLVFGEGVVNDATSVVLFNAITKFDLSDMNTVIALKFAWNFLSLFVFSTLLGVTVSLTLIRVLNLDLSRSLMNLIDLM